MKIVARMKGIFFVDVLIKNPLELTLLGFIFTEPGNIISFVKDER